MENRYYPPALRNIAVLVNRAVGLAEESNRLFAFYDQNLEKLNPVLKNTLLETRNLLFFEALGIIDNLLCGKSKEARLGHEFYGLEMAKFKNFGLHTLNDTLNLQRTKLQKAQDLDADICKQEELYLCRVTPKISANLADIARAVQKKVDAEGVYHSAAKLDFLTLFERQI